MENNTAFYTITEFAKILKVHPNTIRNGIKTGRIQAFRVGKGVKSSFRIPTSEINRMSTLDLERVLNNMIKDQK